MTYETTEVPDIQEEKNHEKSPLLNIYECPLCKKRIEIKVDFESLKQQHGEMEAVIPHIILHGEPLHAMLCYVDKHKAVRGKGYILSIGISKDSLTYQQLSRLWMRSTIELQE